MLNECGFTAASCAKKKRPGAGASGRFLFQARRSGLGQRGVDDLFGFGLDLGEVLCALEAFGVDLVDVLGTGGTRREPAVFGADLEAADGRAVGRGVGQLGGDRLAGQRFGGYLLR